MDIELRHIEKRFNDTCPIKDFNAVIHSGDIISIIGPSGTGKSTLLRCINMLSPPTGGRIFVDGIDITDGRYDLNELRMKIGMVFQSFNLFKHRTVVENVMLPLIDLKHMSRQMAYDIATEQLKLVGLCHTALKYPEELSGGQKQRVSIARTLAMDPEFILFDEPTSALDPLMVHEVENVICKLAKQGKSMMIVTHEMRLAKAISNRVFYVDRGILYEEGTPEQIFEHPEHERTRAFVQHLKPFLYKFLSGNFDSSDLYNKFGQFALRGEFPDSVVEKMFSGLRNISLKFIPFTSEYDMMISLLTAYSSEEKRMSFVVFFQSKNSEQIILKQLKDALADWKFDEMQHVDDPEFDFKASFYQLLADKDA